MFAGALLFTVSSAAFAINPVRTYPINPGLSTGPVERFYQVFVDPNEVAAVLKPVKPLDTCPCGEASSAGWNLVVVNDRTGVAKVTVNKVVIGTLEPLETGVIHKVQPGYYEVALEYDNTFVAPVSLITTRARPTKAKDAEAIMKDGDRDGVPDDDDLCPDEYGTFAAAGCIDSDLDGVVDAKDACPTQVGSRHATRAGCPDKDCDRVPDSLDACPDDPIAASVDPATSNGCPAKAVIKDNKVEISEKIFFDTNAATIKPASFTILDAVARVLVEHPEVGRLEVGGHTDSEGADKYNLKLSQDRVNSVVKYLVSKGVDEKRLLAKGYGETRPIAPNDTETGREMNRRVEFVIVPGPAPKEGGRNPRKKDR
jgi:outer membrane protein OmpA-like peptidoglycan-associated protein